MKKLILIRKIVLGILAVPASIFVIMIGLRIVFHLALFSWKTFWVAVPFLLIICMFLIIRSGLKAAAEGNRQSFW